MIDIESTVFTRAAAELRTAFPGIVVTGEYTNAPAKFPYVSIVEADNYTTAERLDSSGAERYARVLYEVNVYSNRASGKKTECRRIADHIDRMLYRMNFTRISLTPVPNLEDGTIYRLNARYEAETDGNQIYRR